MSADSGPGRREVAYRLFAAEFDDADYSYSESDEERAPNYVVTPTGARVNRLFAVGVLTEVEQVNEEVLRARLADPTGAFVTYAGQYQPDAMAFLDDAEVPAFVALTGKGRTFQPEDSDRVFTSVRPESVNAVDAATRDRWVVTAAEATLRRVAYCAQALRSPESGEALRVRLLEWGAPEGLAAGIPLALDHYGTTEGYLEGLRQVAVQALELVADDRESVEVDLGAPDEPGEGGLGPLPDVGIDATGSGQAAAGTDAAGSGQAAAGTDAAGSGQVDAGSVDADATADAGEPDVETAPTTGSESLDDSAAGAGGGGGAVDQSADTPADTETEPDTEPVEEAAAAGVEQPTATDTDASAADPTGDEDAAADVEVGETGESGPEPTAEEPATDASDDTDAEEPGDFLDEPGSFDDGSGMDGDAASETPEPGDDRFELDDEERESIESEYGTEFSTGTEVDDPGEADIEVPSAEEVAAELDEESSEASAAAESTEQSEPASDPGGAASAPDTDGEPAAGDTDEEPATDDADTDETDADDDEEPAADVDVEDAAVEVMADLDDGDGADREAVVAALVDRHGVTPDEADEAIQSALMSGQCYEPSDGTLKAI